MSFFTWLLILQWFRFSDTRTHTIEGGGGGGGMKRNLKILSNNTTCLYSILFLVQ